MEMPKSWQYFILAAVLGLGVAQAAPASPPESQRSFASADEAVKAFVAALRDHKEADLRAILGAEADRVVNSGDPNADRELHQRFVALYDERHAIEPQGPGRAGLEVGSNHWSLPIPLIKNDGRWSFDTKAGAQAIMDRRVGRNELSAIRALHACVDAQRDYFNRAKRATGSGAYATRLVSTPGSHDGLYWPVAADETDSPLEPLVDAARDAGHPSELAGGEPVLYGEYYFRVLKAQGQNADGGAKSYIQGGHMTSGFALVAWPAGFESTGIMTFIVGPNGDVYQKDLGPDTARIAAEMAAFDPDPTWSRVEVTND
ncbi:MAG: DUF2950 domain-containing protein [Acetobacteraceae bacterium]|nr:DUF2950 domain-containing protein [Acetobacteraceae bacterium]